MPYDIVGEGIERSFKQKCRLLKARIQSKEKSEKGDNLVILKSKYLLAVFKNIESIIIYYHTNSANKLLERKI